MRNMSVLGKQVEPLTFYSFGKVQSHSIIYMVWGTGSIFLTFVYGDEEPMLQPMSVSQRNRHHGLSFFLCLWIYSKTSLAVYRVAGAWATPPPSSTFLVQTHVTNEELRDFSPMEPRLSLQRPPSCPRDPPSSCCWSSRHVDYTWQYFVTFFPAKNQVRLSSACLWPVVSSALIIPSVSATEQICGHKAFSASFSSPAIL